MKLRAVGSSHNADAPCARSAPATVSERAYFILLLDFTKIDKLALQKLPPKVDARKTSLYALLQIQKKRIRHLFQYLMHANAHQTLGHIDSGRRPMLQNSALRTCSQHQASVDNKHVDPNSPLLIFMSFCFGPDGDEVKNTELLGHAWLHPTRPASAYDSQSMLTRGCDEQRLRTALLEYSRCVPEL